MIQKELKIGQELSIEELALFFGVMPGTIKSGNGRKKYFDNLKKYYEIQPIRKDGKRYYKILKKLDDYQDITQMPYNEVFKMHMKIINLIEVSPIQTVYTVAKEVGKDVKLITDHLNMMFGEELFEDGTHGRIVERVWCVLEKDKVRPLTPEELGRFMRIAKEECSLTALVEMDRLVRKSGKVNLKEWMRVYRRTMDKMGMEIVNANRYEIEKSQEEGM